MANGIHFKMMITPKMIAFLLVVTCASLLPVTSGFSRYRVRTTTTPAPRPASQCSDYMDCYECTHNNDGLTCHWSMGRQSCEPVESRDTTRNLTAARPDDCPLLTGSYDGHVYRVSVSNDVTGLLQYLTRVGVNCSRGWMAGQPGQIAHVTTLSYGTGYISCSGYPQPADSHSNPAAVAGSFYVTFGPDRVMLRTNDRSSYYTSNMYDRECGRHREEYCVACMKTEFDQRFYAQWCSRYGSCVDWMVNMTELTVGKKDYPEVKLMLLNEEQSRCEMGGAIISAFEPSSLSWDSDETTVNVKMTGHNLLAYNNTVRVTMAGVDCERPKVLAKDLFSCIMPGNRVPATKYGPIRVDYGPVVGMMHVSGVSAQVRVRNSVVSKAKFRFNGPNELICDPRPETGHHISYGGIASGGTGMAVRFTGLDCVDVTLHVPEIALYGERIGSGIQHYGSCMFMDGPLLMCRSPPVMGGHTVDSDDMVLANAQAFNATMAGHGPTSPIGRFRCGFRLRAKNGDELNVPCGGYTYAVYANPVLDSFTVTDDGAKIVIKGLGVLGLGFSDMDVRVRFASGTAGQCSVKLVTADRIECTAVEYLRPHIRDELQKIWVNIGEAPIMTVHRANSTVVKPAE